ncbi:MAG TPA: DUF4266 domain-containing protein [Steroidobacteraceae bacterium]|nr:DUF4266 domain-containing protein [Steroidobacteraceae bacterium]
MKFIFRGVAVAAVLGAVAMFSGCTTVGVKPWERDILARPEMALDASPVDNSFDEHLYFSKESASGGRGFGGGGCGCN